MSGFASFDPDRFVGESRAPVPVAIGPVSLPAEWQHAITLLQDAARPSYASAARWAQVVQDAVIFATTRAEEAVQAGWSLGNVFGFDPDQSDGFVGLVVDIRGASVLRVDPDVAWIPHERGCRFHYRRMPDDSPLLWQLNGVGRRGRR